MEKLTNLFQPFRMDGDLYRMTIPALSDTEFILKQEALYQQAGFGLYLGDGADEPYLVRKIGAYTFSMLPHRKDDPTSYSYCFIHQNIDSIDQYAVTHRRVFPIRPMLIPLTEDLEDDLTILTDRDGTFVKGGTVYLDGAPMRHEEYKGLTSLERARLGDTADCCDEGTTMEWIVISGRLLCRYCPYWGTAEDLWKAGLRK